MQVVFTKSGFTLSKIDIKTSNDKDYYRCSFVDSANGEYISFPCTKSLAEHIQGIYQDDNNYNFTLSVRFESFYDEKKNVFAYKPWMFNAI